MSATTMTGAQELSLTLVEAIDTNGDSRLQATEFTAFVERLVNSLTASYVAIAAHSGPHGEVA